MLIVVAVAHDGGSAERVGVAGAAVGVADGQGVVAAGAAVVGQAVRQRRPAGEVDRQGVGPAAAVDGHAGPETDPWMSDELPALPVPTSRVTPPDAAIEAPVGTVRLPVVASRTVPNPEETPTTPSMPAAGTLRLPVLETWTAASDVLQGQVHHGREQVAGAADAGGRLQHQVRDVERAGALHAAAAGVQRQCVVAGVGGDVGRQGDVAGGPASDAQDAGRDLGQLGVRQAQFAGRRAEAEVDLLPGGFRLQGDVVRAGVHGGIQHHLVGGQADVGAAAVPALVVSIGWSTVSAVPPVTAPAVMAMSPPLVA